RRHIVEEDLRPEPHRHTLECNHRREFTFNLVSRATGRVTRRKKNSLFYPKKAQKTHEAQRLRDTEAQRHGGSEKPCSFESPWSLSLCAYRDCKNVMIWLRCVLVRARKRDVTFVASPA